MPAHDVLIIGAGLAGQRAALAAADAGASVAIISKVHPVRSHSVAAAGGINAALNPEDTWESHAFDTVKGSDYLGDQDAIEIMCREAPDEILWLEHAGVTFHRSDTGHLGTRAFGGASQARTYYVADITGQAILHVLYEQLMKHHERVDRYEEWFTTTLLQDEDGNCVGCVARDIRTGTLEVFDAKSVILASGGAGQAFKPTTNALICTGDGIAQAYRIGAPLMDMEMIQYHPTTLAENGFLITEGARGEGAHLYNALGERFMEKYAPNKLELASRDVVSRAEQTEINEGRGFPDGTIALDITRVPRKRTLEALREIVNIGKDFAGVDITREPIHIKPGMHYIMGGVKTDFDGQTPIPGLYAAGEVACVSVHGGNRLGANSLLDTLIFGRRSGEHAAQRARGVAMPKAPRERPRRRAGRDRRDPQPGTDPPARPPRLRDQERARRDDEQIRRRLPRRGGPRDGARDRPAPQAGGAERRDRRQGHGLQPGRAGGDRARVHAGRGRGDRDGGAGAQRVARGAVPHRLPRAQRRGLAAPHHRLAQRRRPGAGNGAGDDHQVAASGADLLGVI